jgi:hypothetical protein
MAMVRAKGHAGAAMITAIARVLAVGKLTQGRAALAQRRQTFVASALNAE